MASMHWSSITVASGMASGSGMESLAAMLRAFQMYLAIGLVVSALHAVAVSPPRGYSRLERAVSVVEDALVWPRFLVEVVARVDDRLSALPRENQPVLYGLIRRTLYGRAGLP